MVISPPHPEAAVPGETAQPMRVKIKTPLIPIRVQETSKDAVPLLHFAHAGQTAGQPSNGGSAGGHYAPRSRMHFTPSAVGVLPAAGAPSLPFG